MAQNTNLNVQPYYDDFDKFKNFYRVLFRPGYPIQARELTTMQSILQNQIESVGTHLFKDGAMVIPGQVGYDLGVDAIMLQESFLGANVEDYRTQLEGKIIEGLTSGIKAKVLFSVSDSDSEKGYITLYIKYIESGGDENTTVTFENNEQLITDKEITFGTTLIEVGSPFAQLLPTAAIQKGSAAYVQNGVYFIRGFFVDVPYQYILLDQYGTSPQYRIGLEILESIITPEDDLSLNDNAAGTSNYAAPGAHRFRITTNLVKKTLDDDADKDFLELLRINGDKIEKLVDRSAYDELEKSLALRTYEESGDYVVSDFGISVRENLDDGFNNGVYGRGEVTSSGVTASENKYSLEFGPGTAYVRGYRISTLSPTYVDLDKPRDTDDAQNFVIPFELGNYTNVENIYGFLNASGSTISDAYQTIELRDTFTATAGTAAGNIIGYARAAAIENLSDPDSEFGNTDDKYKLFIFDVQMFTVMELATNVDISAGSLVVGKTSGAKGFLVDAVAAGDHVKLYQVSGVFSKGEMVTVDGLDLDTIEEVHTFQYSDTRQIVGKDEVANTVEFTGDVELLDDAELKGNTFTYDSDPGNILTVDTVGAADSSRTEGTYTIGSSDYSVSPTGGTGATFSIVVDSDGAATVTVTAGGDDYDVDDTITVADAQLGSGGGAALTFDVASVGPATITGLNSNFASDLRVGDRIYFSDTEFVDVNKVDPTDLTADNISNIFDYSNQVVDVTPPSSNAPTSGAVNSLVRYRAQLEETDKANLFSRMPKPYVKSISDESMIVRRTFDAQTVASNSISITLPENEQFQSISDENYTVTVLASTNTDYAVGDQIPLKTLSTESSDLGYISFTSADRTTVQIDNLTNITSVKITATISKNVTTRKSKTLNKMFVLKVNKTTEDLDKQNFNLTYSNLYGTRIQDTDVSLGLVDAVKIHAVYESEDDEDPVIPSVSLVEPVFFATGSVVTGKTSKARARVVDFSSSSLKLTVVYLDGKFVAGETIEGFDSDETAIAGIINDSEGSVVNGSKVITENYILNSGQTPFLYGTSYITRGAGLAAPIRKLKVVLDYYSHSATGDYFGGQSYLNTDYADVPFFENRFLPDFLDFRPGIKNLYSGTGSVSSAAFVNCSTLDFKSRTFPTSSTPSATLFDIPKINTNFRCDFDWYLGRIDKVYLTPEGEFRVIKGKSAEEPAEPDDFDDGMHLATITHAPYGFDPDEDTVIDRSDNRRYTMRDIGRLERRVDQIEYYTSLNMLESDTLNTEVLDASGKNRFKNGFIVDDFTDHEKSDTENPDYNASLDYEEGIMRASHYTQNVPLSINETLTTNLKYPTDEVDDRPLITLEYEEEAFIEQPYASRVENVNPFNVFAYIGNVVLLPASDDWVDTRRLPARVTRIEGNFQATRQRLGANRRGFAPIQWRSWRTTWTGSRVTSSRTFRSGRRSSWGRGRAVDRRRTIETTRRQVRSGIRTRVVPRIDRRSLGDSVVSSTQINWMRSRNVRITATRMKPRTRFYIYFDGKEISDLVTPKIIEVIKDPTTDSRTNSTPFTQGETIKGLTSDCRFKCLNPENWYKSTSDTGYNPYDDSVLASSYSSTTNIINHNVAALAKRNGANGKYRGNMQVGEVLKGESSGARAVVKDRRHITDRYGKYRGNFFIPPPVKNVNPRWRTGTRTLRMTSNATNSTIPGTVASSGQVEFTSTGTLNRIRENVLAVRNADVVRDTVTQNRTVRSTRTETRQVGWWDPLAQSFLIDTEGGVFLTSVEVYFYSKDSNIPINMQIRTMSNGYPTTSILPFADVTIQPDDVQTSEVGAVATKFTFPAPIYIPQSVEHCFVLFSDSNEYQVWVSRMGEDDVSGGRTISEQPYAGVLFKSQNATTWTADQYEDLKFIINRAKFDITSTAKLVLNNADLDEGNDGVTTLDQDPIQTFAPELDLILNSTTLPYTVGARIYQKTSLAEGTIKTVTTTTSGVKLTINDISGTFQVGSESGGNVTYRLVSSQTKLTMVVTGASGNFTVGETITGQTSGATAEVVTWTSSTNTLTLRYVSKAFTAAEEVEGGTSSVTANESTSTYSGDAVESSAISAAFVSSSPTYTAAQRKIRVYHPNHCMHDLDNNVVITGVKSEIADTVLDAAIDDDDTSITVNDASAFHKVINGLAIGADNEGLIRILNATDDTAEIISYSAISSDGKTITVDERGLHGTTAAAHAEGSVVECYNLDGIPLNEINKTHTAISSPTLDTYDLTTTSIGSKGIISGGDKTTATQNFQYEILAPSLQTMVLPKTTITATVNTITGTSINDGSSLSQNSFSNTGDFIDINLSEDNYFNRPQLICSEVNQDNELSGASSLRMDITMTSELDTLSPVIDTDRMSLILTSNRINEPADDNTSKLAVGDEHEAVYITKAATLTNQSTSIKLYFTGYRPPNTSILALYRVLPVGSNESIHDLGFEFFPTSDATIPPTSDIEEYSEYEYEVTGLNFSQYQIKLVLTSPNQAYVPIVKDMRAIALAV